MHLQVAEAPSDDQVLLVELVGALRVLPLDTLIHTVKDVLANPPNSELSRKVCHQTCEQSFYL
ncbi:hypothetical protein DPMN_043989 [Dreissena polymorpha]|uniref:Uncharacterized protein n=1 Tax=Dreissena polymorpha TaxID=45954 RepID=A0A9D4D3C9_DREPO|nr:hypothetical protein DPMN_043989 [Dreissena polymorpha]